MRWCAAALLLFAWTGPALPQDAPRSGYDFMTAETRALQDDDFLNPGFFLVDRGRVLWSQPGPDGRSCQDCHGAAEGSMAGVAARYPAVDAADGALRNLESRINEGRALTGAAPWPYDSPDLLAMTAYLSFLSRGQPVAVRVDGPAAVHFETGRRLYHTRMGQLNLACTHCHDDLAGQRLRGDIISQGQINAFPIHRLLWDQAGSRHRMFDWCMTSLRAEPFAPGSPEFLALELYVAWRGQGLPLESPGVRR